MIARKNPRVAFSEGADQHAHRALAGDGWSAAAQEQS